MIGYYIHHHGRGHATRARAIADALDEPVAGLSSLPAPEGWPGDWITLPLDEGDADHDARAHGRLHWAPLGSPGLRDRGAAISAWIGAAQPRAIVVDVSVEVSLLARLHGIPVVTFALPGDRTDAAHRLGFDIATEILATWPAGVEGMDLGLPAETRRRVTPVGAIGRFAPADDGARVARGAAPHALVLGGGEDDSFSRDAVAALDLAGWSWRRVGGSADWVDDLWPQLRAADVVITHAGDGALADVSAARRPAIVVPQDRPHREQRATARVLRSGLWPAVVVDRTARRDWRPLLDRARTLDGGGWTWWNDGGGARRAAEVIRRAAGTVT
jgi:hypothetical protein